jgi:hypothetical protein
VLWGDLAFACPLEGPVSSGDRHGGKQVNDDNSGLWGVLVLVVIVGLVIALFAATQSNHQLKCNNDSGYYLTHDCSNPGEEFRR